MEEPTSAEPTPRWRFLAPPPPAGLRPRSGPPTFTVLVPAFQASDVIGGALRSTLEQTYPPIEVIVVDDGSSDDLASAVRPFDDQVRLLSTPHVGLPGARNLGLRAASGEFVAFLDADDAFEPEFLAAVSELARVRPDLDIVTSDAWFEVGGRRTGTFHAANPFPVDDQRAAMLAGCFITTKCAVRRSRLAEIGGFDARLTQGEDWDCWLRLMLSGSKVGLVDAPLCCYRLHDGQLSARRAASLQGRYEVMAALLTRSDLTSVERVAVAGRLPGLCARAAVARAWETRSRAAWAQVAGLPAVPRRVRAAAVLGAVWPSSAARFIDHP